MVRQLVALVAVRVVVLVGVRDGEALGAVHDVEVPRVVTLALELGRIPIDRLVDERVNLLRRLFLSAAELVHDLLFGRLGVVVVAARLRVGPLPEFDLVLRVHLDPLRLGREPGEAVVGERIVAVGTVAVPARVLHRSERDLRLALELYLRDLGKVEAERLLEELVALVEDIAAVAVLRGVANRSDALVAVRAADHLVEATEELREVIARMAVEDRADDHRDEHRDRHVDDDVAGAEPRDDAVRGVAGEVVHAALDHVG